jgi:hypothetical protein
MLTFWGAEHRFCDRLSRRAFLSVGALGLAGLTWADLLRLQSATAASPARRRKSVIMIVLPGGPSHLDMYDPKPGATAQIRGEFSPIKTRTPGLDFSELLPLQAAVADKLTVLRGLKTNVKEHYYHEVVTGFPPRLSNGKPAPPERPAFGSVVSYLRGSGPDHLPPYVSLKAPAFGELHEVEDPVFLGAGHRPFTPQGRGVDGLQLGAGLTLDRLGDRRKLLGALDGMRRDLDARGPAARDDFTRRAFEMLSSDKVRSAFDLSREPDKVRDRYGPRAQYTYYGARLGWEPTVFLQARRLAEAGVPVVTLSVGSWDHHSPRDGIFSDLRTMVPLLDRAVHALTTDLYERGLDREVAVVVWGEMGRTPKITPSAGPGQGVGRDHWPDAGCAVFIGGGLRMGQVVGATDPRGERSTDAPYTPQNVLATLYHVLGIDAAQTLTDREGRPVPMLDDTRKIEQLL